jgi:DNA-binding NtrC family response regulator
VDVRVLAATNQDLEKAIALRRFREDLFYRLNVIPIQVPPLRERREDIPHLVEHFLGRIAEERGGKPPGISPAALELLVAHHWPGNVRELENLIERLVVLRGEGDIDVHDVPPPLRSRASAPPVAAPRVPPTGLVLHDVIDRVESDLIRQALEQTHWNKNRASQLLGMNRTTLVEKIKKHGLEAPAQPEVPPPGAS